MLRFSTAADFEILISIFRLSWRTENSSIQVGPFIRGMEFIMTYGSFFNSLRYSDALYRPDYEAVCG
jgi:hypothetical protein